MDIQHADSPSPILNREILQKKADILENNLYNHISKQKDKIKVSFQINRELYPELVIFKALLQLFPRINLNGPVIIAALRSPMAKQIPEGKNLKFKKKLQDFSDADNEDLSRLSLTLETIFTRKTMELVIQGVPEIPTRNGAIAKAYFDYQSCPGKLMKNGKIDFQEINKYPIVMAGENLFYISREFQGKPGMAYNGQVIKVPESVPLKLNLMDGVSVVESQAEECDLDGYFLRASKTGVVILKYSSQKITGVGVSDNLEVERLDYSTGNIGTEYISPINMKIDTICSGFKIRAMGIVEVNVLEGGEIRAESHAQVKTIKAGSKVSARENIVCSFAMKSLLTSETGCITIGNELIDSTIISCGLCFEKSRGIMTSNTVYSETISLKKLYFCGENIIYFGYHSVEKKDALEKSQKELERKKEFLVQKEDSAKETLHIKLKRLIKTIQNDSLLMNNVKQLVLATRTMAFDTLYRELNVISKMMNTKEVSKVKELLDTLKRISDETNALVDQQKKIIEELKATTRKMENMTLSIEGVLRRAATIKIFAGEVDSSIPRKPDLMIDSEKNRNTLIKIGGTYTDGKGFKLVHV